MNNWQKVRLGDTLLFNPSERLAKGITAKKVTMDKLQPFTRNIGDYELAPYTGGAKFRNGDTIMARITPCLENGKTALVSILDDNEIGFGSTEYIVLRNKSGLTDSKFVYYFATSPWFRDIAIKSMVGSSGRQRVQQSVLENLEVGIPPLPTQRRIAQILGSLDDKIELNRRINDNLEQQAQAIFKSWFVDFEPFRDGGFVESELGMIPQGWKVGGLLDIAEYLNGLAMQRFRPTISEKGFPVLKIKELRQGMCDESSKLCSENIKSDFIINDGDVVFSWSGSLMVDIWCGGICGLNQHLFKVTSSKFDKWYYYLWTQTHLERFIRIANDKAVTMGHIKREDLEKSPVLIPDRIAYCRMNDLMTPIYESMIFNKIENVRLANLRDTLLPKLMSGELSVEDAESRV
jgi:type I restriction enzyme S subunit